MPCPSVWGPVSFHLSAWCPATFLNPVYLTCVCVCSTRACSQGLVLAGQVLCPLSHTLALLAPVIF
jgi:hypothetical protein